MNGFLNRGHGAFATLLLVLVPPSHVGLGAQNAEEKGRVLDEIVAKVNSEIITLTDLNREINQLRNALQDEISDEAERARVFEARRKFLLRGLIQNKVMMQRAQELGVSSDIDSDVAAYLEQLRQDAGVPSMEVLDQYFRQRGSTLSEYRQMVKDQMIQRNLVQQYVYSKITLLTPEVEAYYRENAARFTDPAQVELAEILFLTEGKEKDQVRQRAEDALGRLREGASFEELAREVSEGPTASRGGGIGSFVKGSMNEVLEEVAFSIGVGEFSGIVEAPYGFQIVKVVSRKDSELKPIDDVRPEIAEALYQKKAEPEVREFIKQLLKDSYIFVTPKYAEQFDVSGLI